MRKATMYSNLGRIFFLCSVANLCMAQDWVVVYPSYGIGGNAVIEGRVTKRDERASPTAADRKRDNLQRNLDMLINHERVNWPVTVRFGERESHTTTDAEGYFRVSMTGLDSKPGWRTVTAHTADSKGEGGLLIVPLANVHGVISDVDDTIQITEVNNMRHMVTNTLLLNPLQRKAVPGVVEFYRELARTNQQADAAPVFYVSASPRQLHESISTFLEFNKFPRGVLITKRVTNDSTSEPLRDQFAYKTAKIEEIFKSAPTIRFTLIGDDGEKDPEIFAALRDRFPERVEAIWIRHVNPDPKRARLLGQGVLNDRLARYVKLQ
jgi:phosphatidate phosphatase APP1